MKIIEKFCIIPSVYFEVTVPDLENKENYYYKPVEELQMFDIVTIEYQTFTTKLILKEDHVNEVFTGFRNRLEALLNDELPLQKHMLPGMVGHQWNIDTDKDDFNEDYFTYWMFSYHGIQTFVYSKDSKMYLEIAPSYPWHFIEASEGEKVISFSKFMQEYKPIAVYELTKEAVQEWIDKADSILAKMIRV